MTELTAWGWTLACAAALIVGLSKTGIPGLGVFAVAIFANILPAKASTGALLPLLVCADVVAVAVYRRHAVWPHLLRLFPWVAAGVVIGFVVMDQMTDRHMQRVIGVIVVAMVAIHGWRDRRNQTNTVAEPDKQPHRPWFVAAMGLLAGFTTMVANAAGPIMILYLLAVGLPKLEFLGTGAWFFLLVNCFKLPFSHHQGLIHAGSLQFNLVLAPLVVISAAGGRLVARQLPQRLFATLTLGLSLIAGLRLMF